MNWESIGAIGEVVGAVAVIATIGYLALQTRQANRLARAGAVLKLQSEMREHRGAVAFDDELARIILKVEENVGEELSDLDVFRLRVRLQSTLSLIESVYLQFEANVISDEDLVKHHWLFLHIAADAKTYNVWKEESLSPGFVAYIGSLVDDG